MNTDTRNKARNSRSLLRRWDNDQIDTEINTLKAHADKLAELVKALLPLVGHRVNCDPYSGILPKCSCGAQAIVPEARKALAAYEAAQ